MLNTYIYHYLPPTHFGVRYTIFSETIVLLAQTLYAFCNVLSQILLQKIQYALYFVIYNFVKHINML